MLELLVLSWGVLISASVLEQMEMFLVESSSLGLVSNKWGILISAEIAM